MLSLSFLYPTVRMCYCTTDERACYTYGRVMARGCIHPSYHTAFRLPSAPPPSPHTRRDPILVEEPQTTHLSPSHEVSFNKTPNESSLEVIKSLTVAPKNLMDVSDPCTATCSPTPLHAQTCTYPCKTTSCAEDDYVCSHVEQTI